VRIRDRRRVRNHIGSVHAIALCNMAELSAGLATDAGIPASLRWIPKAMTVRYLRKAAGPMTATARVPTIDDTREARDVHASVFDADVTMWISPRPKV
jgi:hypothetical protein